ncbi:nitroreductase family protein [Lacticaseibacillus paracasei]|uniref:nitroreductase family protein n=1 Tax=Lacticaseibacillus paracasei TaxID=1597 RepID=UPI00073CB215|nr:nitroreductase family protein [Lacticaseibacillus paracasei]KTE97015.1 Oxygen-insensitive NADPH nitroreductase [Lacticaseibacillus paracasei]
MFLDHRTIRKFSTQQVDPQCLNRLITVAQHTATSHFLQSFSIIHITDSALRSQIAAISHQTYVDGNGELLIFVADQYRADLCADHPNQLSSTDKFIQAASDTLLAAENLVDAAENQGLGTVILGSILNDPKQLISLLHLPNLTASPTEPHLPDLWRDCRLSRSKTKLQAAHAAKLNELRQYLSLT